MIILEREALRRGVSLAQVLRETVAREADALRARNRPRYAIARSKHGAARAEREDEHASVIALRERLDERKVATLDRRDFSVVRPRHCDALELLPV